MFFTSLNQLRLKETVAVQSCCWCIFPGCSSCCGSEAVDAGRSPPAAASSPGSPAALTLFHSAFSPCSQAGENSKVFVIGESNGINVFIKMGIYDVIRYLKT